VGIGAVAGQGKDFFGLGNHFFGKAEEKIGRAEDFSGRAEEKIGRGNHFSGKAEEISGRGKQNVCSASVRTFGAAGCRWFYTTGTRHVSETGGIKPPASGCAKRPHGRGAKPAAWIK